ncbi:MAG: GNAT family N-acetyltransferase [Clostridia bacterium]|nr:GNAT family N-acetyltransferase [Clostridia bacterium]
MISLETGDALPFVPKISFLQTACAKEAFKGSALAPDIWVQRIHGRTTAVISRLGGRLNITAQNADFEEIKEFINVIGFSEIFCEKEVAALLGFNSPHEFTVLKRLSQKSADFCNIPPLYDLYTALKRGEDGEIDLPDFEVFAPDLSHRLRHGSAVAILKSFGGAVSFSCDFGSIINGISVKKEERGKGLGSLLLDDLLKYLEGEVFVCTDEKTSTFYIKNGFEVCDTAVIIRG